MSSLGCAIIFPHFLHLKTSNGSYIGIKAVILGSDVVCSIKILFTETEFQCPQEHFILSFLRVIQKKMVGRDILRFS